MKQSVGRYVLIGSAEHIVTGDMLHEWPLHVTVIPPFTPNLETEDAMHRAIQGQVDNYHHLDLHIGESDNFGPNNDVPVRRVTSEGLLSLHHDILNDFHDLDIQVDSSYVGDNFRPHISNQGNRVVHFGRIVSLRSLHLVAKLRRSDDYGKLHVKHAYPFGVFFDKD